MSLEANQIRKFSFAVISSDGRGNKCERIKVLNSCKNDIYDWRVTIQIIRYAAIVENDKNLSKFSNGF